MTGPETSEGTVGKVFLPVRRNNPAISAPTEVILSKSVRQVPGQRYQFPEEMQLDIDHARKGEMPDRDAMSRLQPVRESDRTMPAVIVAVLSVLVIAALIAGVVTRLPFGTSVHENVAPTVTVNPTALALAKKCVGRSTGQEIFDISALTSPQTPGNCVPFNATEINGVGIPSTPTVVPGSNAQEAILAEEAGAGALQQNNLGAAITDFQNAVTLDATNAEPRIYLADTQIAQKLATKQIAQIVTIDVAVSFSSDDLATSRDILRGAALAQADLNQSAALPSNTQVSIAIASVGHTVDGAPLLAQYYSDQLAQHNPSHSLGVIAWASPAISVQSAAILLTAFKQLASEGVPVVVPVGATDRFPPTPDPHFFQLSSTDQYQGGAIAQTALSAPFGAYRVVVVQNSTEFSNLEIAGTAAAVLAKQLGPNNVSLLTLGTVTPAQVVNQAQQNGANLIIASGSAREVAQIALAEASRHLTIPIIASHNADDPLLLGIGDPTNPVVAQIQQNPQAMQLIHVMSLADPSEWSFDATAKAASPPGFFEMFSQTYTPLSAGGGAPLSPAQASATAIYSYDAVTLMITAALRSQTLSATHLPLPPDETAALLAITSTHPFQGISGRIAFSSGIPQNRALVLKNVTIDPTQQNALGQPLLMWNPEAIIGQFCAGQCTLG